jgi:hypothetical protein
MASRSRSGNSHKTQYKAYSIKEQWRKNKLAKLERRVLNNETDDSALKTFEAGSKTIGRSKPGKRGWFHPQEQALLKALSTADDETAKELRLKLFNLQAVYEDARPSAVRMKPIQPELPTLIVDQLFNIGIINAKRRKSFKSRMGGLRRR